MAVRKERVKRQLTVSWTLTGTLFVLLCLAGRGTDVERVLFLLTGAAWAVAFVLLYRFVRLEPTVLAEVIEVPVEQIMENSYRVRVVPDPASVEGLARSIDNYGMLLPILVRPRGEKYELVMGERRLLAAKRSGRPWVPALVRSLSDREMLQVSLLENAQRRPPTEVEEARCFARLLREFESLSAAELVDRLGLESDWWARRERLLALPEVVRQAVLLGQITGEHAHALAGIQDPDRQVTWPGASSTGSGTAPKPRAGSGKRKSASPKPAAADLGPYPATRGGTIRA